MVVDPKHGYVSLFVAMTVMANMSELLRGLRNESHEIWSDALMSVLGKSWN